MRLVPAIWALALALVRLSAAQEADTRAPVRDALEAFSPLPLPPRGELRGWRMLVDPAAGPAEHAPASDVFRQRLHDDLALITAEHLYHLLKIAGAAATLTRSDDVCRPGHQPDHGARDIPWDVCVTIRYVDSDVATVSAATEARPEDAALAAALCSALSAHGSAAAPGEPGGNGTPDPAGAPHESASRRAAAACTVDLPAAPDAKALDPALRKACFETAGRLYAGVRHYCAGRRPAPLASGALPDERPPGSQSAARSEHLARAMWPEGPLPASRLDWACRRFAETFITNASLVYCDVSATVEADTVVLRGTTNTALIVRGLERTLHTLGWERVRSEVETLPSRARLGGRLFGACRVPLALTYRQPHRQGGVQTELLLGEPLFLLDRADEYYLLHGADGYWGWVHGDAIEPMTAERFEAYVLRPSAVVLRDIEDARLRVPRGAVVRVLSADPAGVTILLPDDSTLTVPVAQCSVAPQWPTPDAGNAPAEAKLPAIRITADARRAAAAARVAAALDLLYVPYVFGGRSPLGLDCSGLVSSVGVRAGEAPARDAWQQAFAGELVATAWHRARLQPGDLVFFINDSGKIYHAGVALDATHVIHAAPPCVQIGSFDRADPLYDAELDRHFFMAKRP